MQKAESYIKSSFVCKSLQKQLETLLLQWYTNNVILWKLGAKPMRTGRRCADSHGGGKTETAKEDDAHEAVTFMAPYMEVGAFIEQVHSVYPEVNVEIVPYSGDNTPLPAYRICLRRATYRMYAPLRSMFPAR